MKEYCDDNLEEELAYWDKLVECCGTEDTMETPDGIVPMCRVTPRAMREFLDFVLKVRFVKE